MDSELRNDLLLEGTLCFMSASGRYGKSKTKEAIKDVFLILQPWQLNNYTVGDVILSKC